MRALAFCFGIYSLALLHAMRDHFPVWKSWNGIFKILITTNCSMKFDRKVTPGSTHVVYQPINPAVVSFSLQPAGPTLADLHSSKAYSPRLHQIQRDPKRNLCLRIFGAHRMPAPPISPAKKPQVSIRRPLRRQTLLGNDAGENNPRMVLMIFL